MRTAYVVGFVPLKDKCLAPMWSVFSEPNPTAPVCVQWTQLTVDKEDYGAASAAAVEFMDRDVRFKRLESERPCWCVATTDEMRTKIAKQMEEAVTK